MVQPVEQRPITGRRRPGEREEIEPGAHGEEQDNQPEPPVRRRIADRGEDAQAMVEGLAPPLRGEHAERHAEKAEHEPRPGKDERVRDALDESSPSPGAYPIGAPEIEMPDLPDPLRILDGQRLIEAEIVPILLREIRRQARVFRKRRRPARREMDEHETQRRHPEQDKDAIGWRAG